MSIPMQPQAGIIIHKRGAFLGLKTFNWEDFKAAGIGNSARLVSLYKPPEWIV